MKKSIWQFIKFNLVSGIVTVTQLVLVNALLFFLKDWRAPLPGFLRGIFTPQTVGAGNDNWGYVLPFLLSNALANVLGFFVNRKTTFNSDAPKRNVIIFIGVLTVLILISTWVQGRISFLITEHFPSLSHLAPTIAVLIGGMLQFLVLFPLEKFVLLKERKGE